VVVAEGLVEVVAAAVVVEAEEAEDFCCRVPAEE
jgi:hypothetical protein